MTSSSPFKPSFDPGSCLPLARPKQSCYKNAR
jgi:hypothetical protein